MEDISFLHTCEICGQENLLEDELRQHFQTTHLDGAVVCPFCDVSTINLTSEELHIHVNSAHLEYLTPQKEKKEGQKKSDLENQDEKFNPLLVDSVYEMPSCSSKQPPKKSLFFTQQDSDGKDISPLIQCPLCEFSSTNSSSVQDHLDRVHNDRNPTSIDEYSCPFCQKSFESLFKLELHIESIHHESVFTSEDNISNKVLNENLTCPVCKKPGIRSQTEMTIHVEEHFDVQSQYPLAKKAKNFNSSSSGNFKDQVESDFSLAQKLFKEEKEIRDRVGQKEFEKLKAQFGMDNTGNYKQQNLEGMQRAVCSGRLSVQDYYERKEDSKQASNLGFDEGHSATKNLIPKLQSFLKCPVGNSRAFLSTHVDHFASSFGDKGWGCGYRNLQMLLSSLIHCPMYAECLSSLMGTQNIVIPSIEKLQQSIEEAWAMGFDSQGCEQLEGRLKNTKKWIGATEIVAFLTSRGIRTELLDFHAPTSSDGCHPRLFQWVLGYFKDHQGSNQFTPPLFFQHQGHSRTIVGVESTFKKSDTKTRLLVFDPSHSKSQMQKLAGSVTLNEATSVLRILRKPLCTVKSSQYQIVSVTGVFNSKQEMESQKVIRSRRIP